MSGYVLCAHVSRARAGQVNGKCLYVESCIRQLCPQICLAGRMSIRYAIDLFDMIQLIKAQEAADEEEAVSAE